MRDSSSDPPEVILDHDAFPYLTSIEWEALHRLAAVSGEVVVTSLLSTATPELQSLAIRVFMSLELAESHRRVLTPLRVSRNESVKMETSVDSGVGQDRLPLSLWF
ncbi:unnamed protein product [Peronospora destructor]|uniref:Uncharacterized protein n=1 Tax=Peronospora destructor TaxID=86335 RepID=A0AAV0T326_9STRA|nr:unnamed protein product [Peronospora destructor]